MRSSAQLELAAELRLPVFLHERDAHDRFLAILREHRRALPGAVVHCFTGTREELDAYLDLDLHIGITGWICDERRGRDLRALVPRDPARSADDRDRRPVPAAAQHAAPPPRPPQRARLPPHVLDAVAAARGEDAATTAAATTATARAFFGLDSVRVSGPVAPRRG